MNDKAPVSDSGYENKKRQLLEQISAISRQDVMLAFSGGVDSSLLLHLLCQEAAGSGTKVYAVTVHTTLHPVYELAIAETVAGEAGAVHLVINVDEMAEAGIENNPVDRCYRCKKYLFTRLGEKAQELGVSTILEGTNEDDLQVYRPGIKAVKELGIKSPLAEAHVTKEEVRRIAAEYGISVAGRPSTPCLATRFPYGTELSYENMRKVEAGEAYLRALDFYNVRLRVVEELVRIEVDCEDMQKLMEHRTEVLHFMKELGYRYVTLDLDGFRSGSMDIGISFDAG